MTQTLSGGIDALRSAVAGAVFAPGDEGYDDARRVWNADVDGRPAAVVDCRSAADVAAAVRFARDAGWEIAVRGGAHSVTGLSSCDDGLVINLRRLNAVAVDPAERRVRVQGGALLGDVDAATQPHGLAVPAGMVSHTGVGGLTLGGGLGWLTRRGGLTIDNLLAAQVVLADGRTVRAAPEENPDLFWAIRGGGGNFGVVVEFEFRLIDAGPMVQFGLFFWDEGRGREVLGLARQLVAALPRSLTLLPAAGLSAPPEPFVPVEHRGRNGYALLLTGFGDPAEHGEVAERIRAELPPLFDVVTPMPFTALQQLLDEANGWGLHSYEIGCYFEDFSDEVIEVITAHARRKRSPLSAMLFYRLDGAYCDAREEDTAFGGARTPRWAGFLLGISPTAAGLPAERSWVRAVKRDLGPRLLAAGSYVNAGGQDPDQVKATYGAKYQRLAAIKAAYDPENLFHRNVNIPAAAPGRPPG